MKPFLIKNVKIVNSGRVFYSDLLIKNQRIEKIAPEISTLNFNYNEFDASGLTLLPGVIDDQVHFREPGLTHKGDIYSESKAAVAGGITSFMEMPNTNPQAVTQSLLEEKYQLASNKSLANFSFYMGATNDNIEELLKTDANNVCGIKIFMGSSTGNMLVDNEKTLSDIFSKVSNLKAVHCEDETTIIKNTKIYKDKYGDLMPISMHPEIRSEEACYLSSSYAVELAKKYNSRLHILHVSTEKELSLFRNDIEPNKKLITSEVCVHHLWFDNSDYDKFGTRIKWNPSIKYKKDKDALMDALIDNRIDVVATDHAPHTIDEKNNNYWKAPSGGPLVQHSLNVMLEFYKKGKISLEKVVEKMCHIPSMIFNVSERGFVEEGFFADLVLVSLNSGYQVNKDNLLYKCNWSPFEGQQFSTSVISTFINGNRTFHKGSFDESIKGMRLRFQ